jgi:CheY-like chemotaxis protein
MTVRKILWLENELRYHQIFADYLRMKGHEVQMTGRVSEAEALLGSGAFDLLILDVMIPTWDEDEEKLYPPDETDRGHLTGLAFYRKMQKNSDLKAIPVLVYTIRLDTQLLDAFRQEGLPDGCFATKFEYRDPEALLQKLEEIARAM